MANKVDATFHQEIAQSIGTSAASVHDDLELPQQLDALVGFCKELESIRHSIENFEVVLPQYSREVRLGEWQIRVVNVDRLATVYGAEKVADTMVVVKW